MVATRHSISRVLVQSQVSSYVCRSCQHQISRAGVSVQQQRFASNSELQATEKTGRNVWGTHSPYRFKDLYGGQSFIGKRRVHQQARQASLGGKTAVRQTSTSSTGRTEAQTYSQREDPEEYTPTENWEGLQYVGSEGNWRDTPPQPEDGFSTWLNSTPIVATDRTQLVSCLHRALVECLACTQAGLNPNSTLHLDSTQLDRNIVVNIADAKIAPSEAGNPGQVHFASETHAKGVIEVLAAVDSALNGSGPQSENEPMPSMNAEAADSKSNDATLWEPFAQPGQVVTTHRTVHDESFLNQQLDMEDPLTFIVLKRFSQLSGHQIPDPVLNTLYSSNHPLSFLIEQLDQLVVRPKPKKLADVLIRQPDLKKCSNVLVFPRRETSVDKEKEVGRWKIIEKELEERGLPALGRLKM